MATFGIVHVGLSAQECNGTVLWAWAHQDGTGHGSVSDGTVGVGFLAALEGVLADPSTADCYVHVYADDAQFTSALSDVALSLGRVSVQPWTDQTRSGRLVRTARGIVRQEHQARQPAPADSRPPARMIATDGSSGHFGSPGLGHVSGWAWVSDTGLYAHGAIPGSILDAETFAIERALEALDPAVDVTIVSDSVRALAIVESLRSGAPVPGVRRTLKALVPARPRVTYTWVKSHSGHALNDVADRLAVLARRHRQAATPAGTTTLVANRILAESHLGAGTALSHLAATA